MTLISNEKIACFEPVWAPYHGFSLLFDNPGNALEPMGNLKKVACDIHGDSELSLYRALADAMETVGPAALMNTCLFCTLPYDSYHVTIWDGINDGNIIGVAASHRKELETYLQGFPESFATAAKVTETVNASKLAAGDDWNIGFRFEKLAIWSNRALVARLSPVDNSSAAMLDRMLDERKILNGKVGTLLDMNLNKAFKPHVSLGYFADPDLADVCRKDLGGIEEIFTKKTAGLSIVFHSVALYGFTDMATFFK